MRSYLVPSLTLIIVVFGVTVSGQSKIPPVAEWETLHPDGEEFSVLIPKGSTFEASKEPYHKMELNSRMYILQTTSGPVFAVVSLSGIKSNPALYTETQRMNSYVDAFKTLFAPKVRKDTIPKLTLVRDKTLAGNDGREYKMTIGDLNGTAQVFATRKRFYSVVYLNTKKDDAIQEQFLSSFSLPEKSAAPPTATAANNAENAADAPNASAESSPAKPNNEAEQADANRARADATKRGPISAGVLNSRALNLPRPDYPPDAKAAGIEGVVVVQVLIDEQGNVVEAHAVSGPKLLQPVSVSAAQQAKFQPTFLAGEAVKVTGVLVFNFGRPMS